jgi:drug/metabolite transporter (DMT)-like permease
MSRNAGIPIALGAAVLFGASTPLAKLALSSAHPLLVAGLLYLGSGIGLFVVRSIRSGQTTETPLSRTDLPWLAGAILAGGVVGPALLLLGLMATSASAASLLLNLEAVATATIAWIVFRENVDKRVGAGFALILLGAFSFHYPQKVGLLSQRARYLSQPPAFVGELITTSRVKSRAVIHRKSPCGRVSRLAQ